MRGDYALPYLTGHPWAITQNVLSSILRIVEERQDLDAVAARLGRPLEHTANEVEQRGSVAVMAIHGPIFRRASFFSAVSGGTDIDSFSRDLTTALEDQRVESILLDIDSPGGEAAGVAEMAQMIREASDTKPVWAYVGSMAYSGGYWLASAAQRIVMHDSAFAGSIGVIATVTDSSKRKERDGYTEHEFVSSQSPLKRMDPNTDSGRLQLQEMVDVMADQFIAQVAAFRDVTPDFVKDNFGRGGVLVARRAIAAGMADEAGTYEGVLAQMNARNNAGTLVRIAAAGNGLHAGTTSAEEVEHMAEAVQPDLNVVRAEAASAEQARIKTIMESPEAAGRDALARHLAFGTRMNADEACRLLAAAEKAAPKQEEQKKEDQFAAHMRMIQNPKVGASGEDPEDDEQKEVALITSFLPSAQRRRAAL